MLTLDDKIPEYPLEPEDDGTETSYSFEEEQPRLSSEVILGGDQVLDVDETIGNEAGLEHFDEEQPAEPVPFEANLAETLEESVIRSIGVQCQDLYRDDLASRQDWEETVAKGRELLGVEIKPPAETPFKGSSNVVDPLILEAIVRFQSNVMSEIFPPDGPVDMKIMGEVTPEKLDSATRKKDYMNHVLTSEMPDYRDQKEKLCWDLAFCGAAFTRTMNDPETGEAVTQYLPAEDVIIPWGYSNLATAPRYSIRMPRTDSQEIKRLQSAGWYCNCQLGAPSVPDQGPIAEAKDRMAKQEPSMSSQDFYTIVEMVVKLNIDGTDEYDTNGKASPYRVCFELDSGTVLSIRRNWDPADMFHRTLRSETQYTFIPGPGSYGYGMVHMIGNLAKADNGILRALMDAGTLNTLPGGLCVEGLRSREGTIRYRPFEWVPVETAGMPLSQSLFPMPVKEPSQVLAAVRQEIKADARSLASMADTQIMPSSGEMPVGTMLAVLERQLKVVSAIQARMHDSLKQEFKILETCIHKQLLKRIGDGQEYPYDVEGGNRNIKLQDFNGQLISVPVSNPNSSTYAQRFLQYQFALTLAQQAPHVYDLPAIHREMLKFLGIKEVSLLIPDKSKVPPVDPATAVSLILMGKPVRAYEWQSHESHLRTVMAMLNDPQLKQMIGQMPQAQQVVGAATAYVMEHIAFLVREQIQEQLGFPLPPIGEPLSPEIEIQLSEAIAEAANRWLQLDVQKARMQEAIAKMQDPVVQQENRALDIQEFKEKQAAQINAAKLEADKAKAENRELTERLRIDSNERSKMLQHKEELLWIQSEIEKTDSLTPPQVQEILARVRKLNKEAEVIGATATQNATGNHDSGT